MAELIPDLIAIRFLPMSGQGQVAGATQGILHPFRVDRPKFVSEAQVDVVLKNRALFAPWCLYGSNVCTMSSLPASRCLESRAGNASG